MFLTTIDVTIYAFLIPHMKLLKDMGCEVEVACVYTGFADRIEKEDFKVHSIPFNRNPLSFNNMKAVFELYRLMRENNYTMIHTHTPVASFIGRIVARNVEVPRIVYTAHGFHFHELGNPLKNFLYYRLEKFAGRFTDDLITINKDDYKVAVEKNLAPNGKVVYIKGVGVDTDKFNPDKVSTNGIGDSLLNFKGSVLISVGRLDKEKHFDHIIRALWLVNQRQIDFKFLVVGDGSEEYFLKNLSTTLSLQSKVEFLGYVKNVEKYLKISSMFVFASSREGLPVSVVEAMTMEKPIVAYNIRGVRDLIDDGVNGFLVPFGDVKGLAEKTKYLMENPQLAKEMGKKGREKIEREFSLKVILKDMKKLYKEILEEGI